MITSWSDLTQVRFLIFIILDVTHALCGVQKMFSLKIAICSKISCNKFNWITCWNLYFNIIYQGQYVLFTRLHLPLLYYHRNVIPLLIYTIFYVIVLYHTYDCPESNSHVKSMIYSMLHMIAVVQFLLYGCK